MDPSYLGRTITAPTAQKPSGLIQKRTLLIVLGLGGAILVAAIMMIASKDNSGPLQQRLSARQATATAILADGQKNITGDSLSKLNSELTLVLSSDTAKLEPALKAAGMKKVDKKITAAEADSATFEKLKDAKLNAQYDSTYRSILTQKLESLRALIRELHGETKSKDLRPLLDTEYKHLSTYLEALDNLEN